MNVHGLFLLQTFFFTYLIYSQKILGESDIIRVRISGESDATYLSFSFSLN